MHPRGKSGISEESGASTEQISALYTKVGRTLSSPQVKSGITRDVYSYDNENKPRE